MPDKDISSAASKLSFYYEGDVDRYIDGGDYDKLNACHKAIDESVLSELDAEKIISYCISTLNFDGGIQLDRATELRQSCNEFIKRLSENGKSLIAKMPFYLGEKEDGGLEKIIALIIMVLTLDFQAFIHYINHLVVSVQFCP
jgi:hypothetical protein